MGFTPQDLMRVVREVKAVNPDAFEVKYKPGQPRVPAGSGAGGQFASTGGGARGGGDLTGFTGGARIGGGYAGRNENPYVQGTSNFHAFAAAKEVESQGIPVKGQKFVRKYVQTLQSRGVDKETAINGTMNILPNIGGVVGRAAMAKQFDKYWKN